MGTGVVCITPPAVWVMSSKRRNNSLRLKESLDVCRDRLFLFSDHLPPDLVINHHDSPEYQPLDHQLTDTGSQVLDFVWCFIVQMGLGPRKAEQGCMHNSQAAEELGVGHCQSIQAAKWSLPASRSKLDPYRKWLPSFYDCNVLIATLGITCRAGNNEGTE